ncbi:hypothetical protein RvY_05783-2 [Ramazzottius varieornatus]|uniref:Galactokinase n=1 Tax=Ramazzottius varieornatus TaxID=947166 RepID=A0A1D1V581_RAMVA|nr:hypothetical protein RvY_05783-2 [Ramazzottius varieornatus]
MAKDGHSDVVTAPEVDSLIEQAKAAFLKKFGRPAEYCGIAPGRVNLIGEHTDYNDGYVLPVALPNVTVVVGSPKLTPGPSRVATLSDQVGDPKEEVIEARPKPPTAKSAGWANYVKGVVANFNGQLGVIQPFEALITTSVPIGGGLSSSASLEVATYMFLAAMTKQMLHINYRNVAKACQTAEHQFAHMPCGIMDQMISCLGKPGTAMLLDCRSLETEFVPLDDPEVVILITNSNVKHKLTGSEYPTRKASCVNAAKLFGLPSLRELDMKRLKERQKDMDEEMFRRVRHVVTEIRRTKEAAEALKAKNYTEVGRLMNESHVSMRDDFEISTPELDQLVAAAQTVPEVYGSRMTGGGFGGCTVTLVKSSGLHKAIDVMRETYAGKATFYICQPASGCRGMELQT